MKFVPFVNEADPSSPEQAAKRAAGADDALTLRHQIEIAGGWKFLLPVSSPLGGRSASVEIDLSPFKGRDLDSTYVVIGVRYEPDDQAERKALSDHIIARARKSP